MQIDYSVYANPTHLHRNSFPQLVAQDETRQIDLMLIESLSRFVSGYCE